MTSIRRGRVDCPAVWHVWSWQAETHIPHPCRYGWGTAQHPRTEQRGDLRLPWPVHESADGYSWIAGECLGRPEPLPTVDTPQGTDVLTVPVEDAPILETLTPQGFDATGPQTLIYQGIRDRDPQTLT